MRARGPQWLLLENVSFLLHLDRGRGMRFLVDELEKRSFTWAYRSSIARRSVFRSAAKE